VKRMFYRIDPHQVIRQSLDGVANRSACACGVAEGRKMVKTWVETKFYGLKIALFSGLSGY